MWFWATRIRSTTVSRPGTRMSSRARTSAWAGSTSRTWKWAASVGVIRPTAVTDFALFIYTLFTIPVKNIINLQRGYEIWTSLTFEWPTRGWFAKSPDFEWLDIKFVGYQIPTVFRVEIHWFNKPYNHSFLFYQSFSFKNPGQKLTWWIWTYVIKINCSSGSIWILEYLARQSNPLFLDLNIDQLKFHEICV